MKPKGYWLVEKSRNIREWFENFARQRGFNPFVPDFWYSVQKCDIEVLYWLDENRLIKMNRSL